MRYTVNQIAQNHKVNGFVENLDDGRVQIVAEGELQALEQFFIAVESTTTGKIQRMDRFQSEATGEFANFSIRR